MSVDPSRTGERLGLLVQQMIGLVHRRFAGDANEILSEAGLTLPQLVALHVLLYGGPQSISGLMEHLRLSTSATSHLVDRLVEKGFVDRREHPTDRRQKRVAVTPSGAGLVERLAKERTEEFARALCTLDPELQEQLVTVFERAVEQLARDLPRRGEE